MAGRLAHGRGHVSPCYMKKNFMQHERKFRAARKNNSCSAKKDSMLHGKKFRAAWNNVLCSENEVGWHVQEFIQLPPLFIL